jgi:Flp pilus assembly protein CpaB
MSMQPPSVPNTPAFGTPASASAPRKVTPKRTNRLFVIAIFAIAAIAFLIVVVGTGDGSQKWVLVSNQPIRARDAIDVDLFDAKQLSEDAVVAGAITGDTEDAVDRKLKELAENGATAQYPLPRGGQLSESLISTETELARPLGENERLISFPGSYDVTLAGNIKVGDRVDMYVVGDNTTPVANMLVPDVEVVGIALPEAQVSSLYQRQVAAAENGEDLSVAEVTPADPIPGVFTVRVDQSDATAIAVAAQHANIVLVYRGSDAATAVVDPLDLITVLCTARIPASTDPNIPSPEYVPGQLPAACNNG